MTITKGIGDTTYASGMRLRIGDDICIETALCHPVLHLKTVILANSYNEASHELLVDPGVSGGVAVGARRPRLTAIAASYGAFGNEVSSAKTRSVSDLQWTRPDGSGANDRPGDGEFR